MPSVGAFSISVIVSFSIDSVSYFLFVNPTSDSALQSSRIVTKYSASSPEMGFTGTFKSECTKSGCLVDSEFSEDTDV